MTDAGMEMQELAKILGHLTKKVNDKMRDIHNKTYNDVGEMAELKASIFVEIPKRSTLCWPLVSTINRPRRKNSNPQCSHIFDNELID